MSDYSSLSYDGQTSDDTFDVPAESTTPAASSPSSPKPARSSSRTKRISRREVTSILDAYQRFADLDDDDLIVVAGLLGCEPTARELTLASLTATSTSTASVATVLEWRELAVSSEMEATLAVMSASEDRKAMKAAWGLLHGLGLVKAEPGRGRYDTVRDVVKALLSMTDEQGAQIERARELLS